ncbi:MAG: hypothetical protein NVS1B7_5460 [Candidatus Saccharimonadales bacterium]
MHNLWLPEQKPPQLDERVVDKISMDVLQHGLTKFYVNMLPVVIDNQPLIGEHLDALKLNDDQDNRPIRVLRTSAVVTAYAYLETGYDQPLDHDTLRLSLMDAEIEGIPEAYLTSFCNDQQLQRLTGTLALASELRDGADLFDYPKILDIGAGNVRHYLQFAA